MFSKINEQSVQKFKEMYDSYPDYTLTIEPKSEIEDINKLEQKVGSLPTALKEFYLHVGSIATDYLNENWEFSIYSPSELLTRLNKEKTHRLNSIGIIDLIIFDWGNDRPEFEAYFPREAIDYLNNNYKCFGLHTTDSFLEEKVYLYFDKDGRFGTVKYHQDDFEQLVDDFLNPMLEGNNNIQTFDQCLSSIFNNIIAGLDEMEMD